MRVYLNDGDIVVAGIREWRYHRGELIRCNLKSHYEGVTVEKVTKAVCDALGVTDADLSSHTRKVEYVRARKAYCYYLYNYAGVKTEEIAKIIDRKHCNVIHLKECWHNDIMMHSYTATLHSIIVNLINNIK